MGFLPKAMGTRPRLACEVRAEGVVAARADDAAGGLSAVEHVAFASGTGSASGSTRAEKIAAIKRVLDAVGQRGREVTLVVPDTAARVLLVDFDELPAKTSEALPVVRFRLKKLLPFDADAAAVSYQVMAQTRTSTQVLAVAMQRESLAEYEGIVRDAGYEPGAVLPSTLAALAGLDQERAASLIVNAGREAVTTAIVNGGVLLLHRTVSLATGEVDGGQAATAVLPDARTAGVAIAIVPPRTTATTANEATQEVSRETTIAAIAARFAAMEGQTTPAPRAPEAPQVSRVGSALAASMVGQTRPSQMEGPSTSASALGKTEAAVPAEEIAQAVNVAAAYFEDTLEAAPQEILSAGTVAADALSRMLGFGEAPRVKEIVGSGANGGVPPGWLAGVQGALRS